MSKEDGKTLEISQQSELSNYEKIFTSLAAGGVAGGLAKTVIAPLDRCHSLNCKCGNDLTIFDRSKIFFQTNETRNYRFRYAIRWLRHGYKTEGFFSLWRGNTATLARIVPYSAINFMAFEQYKKLLKVEEHGTNPLYRSKFLINSYISLNVVSKIIDKFIGQICCWQLGRIHRTDVDLSSGQSEGGDGSDQHQLWQQTVQQLGSGVCQHHQE